MKSYSLIFGSFFKNLSHYLFFIEFLLITIKNIIELKLKLKNLLNFIFNIKNKIN